MHSVNFFPKLKFEKMQFLDFLHTNTIKGFAILIIIISHIGNGIGVRFFAPLGGTGVAMFLIVSGYGLSESFKKKGLNHYFKNKIVKVWLPYIIFELIARQLYISDTASNAILDVLLIKPLHTYGWYLNYLAFWYIAFFVVKKCNMKFPKLNEMAMYLILAAVIFLFCGELRAEQALSFVFGIVLSKYGYTFMKKWKTAIAFFLIGIVFFAARQPQAIRNVERLFYLFCMINNLCWALSFISFIYLFNVRVCNMLLNFCGELSFELFLIHRYTLLFFLKPRTILGFFIFALTSIILSILYRYVIQVLNNVLTTGGNKNGKPT
ncbi:MAG: acyltransferase family protein [Clostridia bacterium]|nr:acyltransferase family protein [Clostridia bacterium]